MQSNTLKAATPRMTSPRVGRGGKRGKTSGRGTKGQNARAGHKNRPEMRDIIKKIPKLRGHGKNRSRTVRPREGYEAVNIGALEVVFAAGDTVTVAELYRKGLVRSRGGKVSRVKILASGSLTKALSLSGMLASEAAKAAIEAAGGSLV
jgi:large subunit ribosomal protein L15